MVMTQSCNSSSLYTHLIPAFNIGPQHFSHTSATWKTQVHHFSLGKQEEQGKLLWMCCKISPNVLDFVRQRNVWLKVGSSQLCAKHFPYLYRSTPILDITSTLNAYEDGTDSTFRNVGTKSSDAGRLPKKHNTAFNHGGSLKSRLSHIFTQTKV